ncbi:ParB/RepB/Spo0J family partition protein [Persicimonas caeni]|uniref:ParB/RepB/Spo0J family partition protein n=1 Tax=Persicimonas caeni TaxID=2292766 RepID=A0A4Y6PLY5_PERCE|nr:ParB/RepB/Spo0J family partition protein [Persicimonas caeni]QDG49272.1 ParB/RepB/Spo0J family partition protein [Persicimonas caeni]QED30493.1 ParB/RepB/Spo0J family partition protein [Persicimonas caeni]
MTDSNDNTPSRQRRRALGRGLGALIPRQQQGGNPREYQYLAVEDIQPAESQPRRDFDEAALRQLSESIEESGVIQPLVVRQVDDGYELIAGERRWRAAQMAGEEQVPAVVKDVTDAEAYAIALVENVQREDLNPMEEAAAYARLLEEFDFTQEELAQQVGKSRSSVANSVRLLTLPQKVCDMVASGDLSAGHARALVGLPSDIALRLATRIVKKGLSVREAEQLAKSMKEQGEAQAKPKKKPTYRDDAQTRQITNQLQHALGTKVKLRDKHGKGKVEIFYEDYEVLQAVLDRLGIE